MNFISLIGAAAAVLTVFNMFPQYVQVMKTKHTRDLSLATFVSITLSAVLWVTYGILKHDPTIIFANSAVGYFCASILYMKFKYD